MTRRVFATTVRTVTAAALLAGGLTVALPGLLRDWSGDLQLVLTRDGAGAEVLKKFTSDVDF
ncbi:hypothetical protein AB0M39_19710, partial [Streptomyces sp. NPDC051907]|uniref:hypothetical protein n=1 Tax=Streptomyces sp. NPDC051907 TaxID=3155284 RepID=UPI00342BA8F5